VNDDLKVSRLPDLPPRPSCPTATPARAISAALGMPLGENRRRSKHRPLSLSPGRPMPPFHAGWPARANSSRATTPDHRPPPPGV